MLDLKLTYGKRYRIELDPSYEAETISGKSSDIAWYYELVGLYGRIYAHSESQLQLHIKPRLGRRLKALNLPDWTVTQNTSEGYSFVFPAKDISIAFKWIKPRKRRIGHPAPHLAAYHFKPKQEAST